MLVEFSSIMHRFFANQPLIHSHKTKSQISSNCLLALSCLFYLVWLYQIFILVRVITIDTRGNLEGWFPSLHESESSKSIDRYLREFSRKIINTPKFVRLDWLKSEKLLEVSELLEQQGLERFLRLAGNIYPDFVKVFFMNLKVKEERLESRVKAVTMKINSFYMDGSGCYQM